MIKIGSIVTLKRGPTSVGIVTKLFKPKQSRNDPRRMWRTNDWYATVKFPSSGKEEEMLYILLKEIA